jgi:hypothetical protein
MSPANRIPPDLLRLRMELQRHQDLTPAEAAEAADLLVGMVVTLEQLAAEVGAIQETMARTAKGRRTSPAQ